MMNDHITPKQYEMIMKIINSSPLYEAHIIEELKRAFKTAYNPPCGLSHK